MGMYQHIRELWRDPQANMPELWQARLIKWRRENSVVKIEKPTRLDRARSLGYKAKKGYVMIRVRVKRGGRRREQIKKGRRSKAMRSRKIVGKNYKWIAEERAQKKFTNLEVLNSYEVAKDGIYYWFEIVMVDPYRPEIKADKKINWICLRKHTNRVYKGKTSAGRKSRGLRNKGKGAEKIRPSLSAHNNRGTN